jgi:hypothetical protein
VPKFIIIALLAASSAAQAAPAVKTTFDREAIQREQRIKDLSEAPPSVRNICKRC